MSSKGNKKRVGMAEIGSKWLEMAGMGWKWLKMAGIARNGSNWLEKAETG